jgi:hypothetical protein
MNEWRRWLPMRSGLASAEGSTGLPFWQDESYDHWVRGPEELAKIVRYIEENPVVAGLVSRGEDWRWSSAFGMAQGQARRPGQEAGPT